jgi:anhydro-N-acetylmuramic acid kinase
MRNVGTSSHRRQAMGRPLTKRSWTAIGLMSGTSMDGIDVAILQTDGQNRITRLGNRFVAYDPAFRRRIDSALETAKAIRDRTERPGDLADLERAITTRHAEAVRDAVSKLAPGHVDVIGFHGQTVLHRPAERLTVQLGDGCMLADMTGIPVVSDMRANDMVHGGQGAPLVPAYHAALAKALFGRRKAKPVAFVNIGGIANITHVSPDSGVYAFDTGPGNALIDQFVQMKAGVPYDDGGAIGSEGAINQAVLAHYLGDPFFDRSVPKSLDRNDFTLDNAAELELADGANTLAAVTAHSIFAAIRHLPERPAQWILCGGGRKNANIVAELSRLASAAGAVVQSADELGFNGDAMEAEAWAFLAVRSLRGLPLSFPTTTGVSEPVSGGILAKPGA